MIIIKCPCCDYYTIESEEDVIIEYCEVCGWRYDLPAHQFPDMVIGYNKISLNDARNNFRLFKAIKREFLGTDRVPEELPENNM